MKSICLYFQIHQPLRLKRYRFFDIGYDHYYYDDFTNESIIRKVIKESYLPANNILLSLLKKHDKQFKVSFSITGTALDQFASYAPEMIDSFRQLANTGGVEFIAETDAHSLASLKDQDEFKAQVMTHSRRIEELFGQKPQVFRNTELIYSDEIGNMVAAMGFKGMITEGAKHILGWKSPNYVYCNAINPKLKLLMRNYALSDDISMRFGEQAWSEWPLTTEKMMDWLKQLDAKEEIVNIFMDYETFGNHQKKESGIFEFLEHLPSTVLKEGSFEFTTPSEAIRTLQPIAAAHVPHPISWVDEERDLSAWLGNSLQDEALAKLYRMRKDVIELDDRRINKDWYYLQCSSHFYYMCTKFFSDSDIQAYFNPYNSPYDAFINYMNVLSDFELRVKNLLEEKIQASNPKNELLKKDKEIKQYKAEIKKLQKQIYPH